MKVLKSILLFSAIFGLTFMVSCSDDDVTPEPEPTPEPGPVDEVYEAVTNLAAVPGDEEVELSWGMPSGYSPSDFAISYNAVTTYTGGAMTYLVENLTNDTEYTFSVQAVYENGISEAVTVSATPTASRFPVTTLGAVAGDKTVTLSWLKPSSGVQSYTLEYYSTLDATNVTTETLDADATTYTVSNLLNDVPYCFSLTAVYAKGDAEAATVTATPVTDAPYYSVDQESVFLGQSITFTFNIEDHPSATNITWTFPNGDTSSETEVEYTFTTGGTQTVTLKATVGGVDMEWTITVEVREYIVYSTSWTKSGTTANGFKGTCPVFSPDGKTVYVITFNAITGLYAFDIASGEEKWRYIPSTNAGSYNPLTVNPVTGDIYFGTTTSGLFYAVTEEGDLKWRFGSAGSMKSCAPAVSADGSTVFICDADGSTFAINAQDGSQIWRYNCSAAGSGLLVNGNELLVGATSHAYFLNASTGELITDITLTNNMTDITGFAVSNDKKTAYLPTMKGITAIDLEAHTESIVSTFSNEGVRLYEICVAPNGTLFAADYASYVYNVSADLTTRNWRARVYSDYYGANYSRPCVDSENRFYITSGNVLDVNYIWDANGTLIDSYSVGESSYQRSMSGNNILNGVYYGALQGQESAGGEDGIFFGKYVGAERPDTWCSHGGDICGSCCIK